MTDLIFPLSPACTDFMTLHEPFQSKPVISIAPSSTYYQQNPNVAVETKNSAGYDSLERFAVAIGDKRSKHLC